MLYFHGTESSNYAVTVMLKDISSVVVELTIHNPPYQNSGPREGNWHLNAKVAVARVLSEAGYDVWYEKDIWSQDGVYVFHVDILLNNNIVVEVDGKKNHGTKRKMAKDRWRTQELKKVGYQVIRITVDEALGAPEQIIKQADIISGRNKKSRLD